VSGEKMTFCADCDAYFSAFLAASDHRTAKQALESYDRHRDEDHGRRRGGN